MNVLFDTNVIVDILQNNEFCLHSYAAYDVCLIRSYRPCLAVSAMPDLEYLLHARKIASGAQVKRYLGTILELFNVMDMAECDCVLAHESSLPDFEDAMIAFAAKRTGMDCIITRDERGFKNGPVPYMTPEAFVETYKPDDINYSEIDLGNLT